MINIRNLLTGIAVGAVVALLVREINQFGLDFAQGACVRRALWKHW